MTDPLTMHAAVTAYREDRLAEAARARLVRIAACCRPAALRELVRSLRATARALVPHRTAAHACCA